MRNPVFIALACVVVAQVAAECRNGTRQLASVDDPHLVVRLMNPSAANKSVVDYLWIENPKICLDVIADALASRDMVGYTQPIPPQSPVESVSACLAFVIRECQVNEVVGTYDAEANVDMTTGGMARCHGTCSDGQTKLLITETKPDKNGPAKPSES